MNKKFNYKESSTLNFHLSEQSLHKSKNEQIQRLVLFLNRAASDKLFGTANMPTIVNNAVQAVNQIKCIRPDVHQP